MFQPYRNDKNYGITFLFSLAVFFLLSFSAAARKNIAPDAEVKRYLPIDTTSINTEVARFYLNRSRYYATTGNDQKAYQYFERYTQVKDSLFSRTQQQEIQKLKQDVAAANKDKELALKQIQIAYNKELASGKNTVILFLYGGMALLLMLSLMSVKRYADKQNILKKVRKQKSHDMEISLINAGFQGEQEERNKIALQLKGTIGPLLGSVREKLQYLEHVHNTIRQYPAFKETQKIVGDVSIELDDISSSLASSDIETSGLVHALDRFIHNVPKGDKLTLSLIVQGKEIRLALEKELIIYRMVQELVQNIIKHAQADIATISISYRVQEINITVTDNGNGCDIDMQTKGIGWTNVKDKLLYLSGSYSIVNDRGTAVSLFIPLK
jgi:signal transduction histidine kinase